MKNQQNGPDLSGFANAAGAADLLKDGQTAARLMASREAKQLLAMLEQQSGGELQNMAQAALKGDPSRLMALVDRVTAAGEGARMAEQLRQKVPNK